MSYTHSEYMQKLREANLKEEKLYIINDNLVIAPVDYYICKEETNISDGTVNPNYPDIYKQRLASQCRETDILRQKEYNKSTDNLILRKLRKQLLNDWTDKDEVELKSTLQNLILQIKEKYPYPTVK